MSRHYRGEEEREWHGQRPCGGRWHDAKPVRLEPCGVSRTGGSVRSLGGLVEEFLLEAKSFKVGKSLGGYS